MTTTPAPRRARPTARRIAGATAPLVALLAVAAAPAGLAAQAADRAVFVVRQGADTLAVEVASRESHRAEGSLWMRAPRLRVGQVLDLGDSALVTRITTSLAQGARGDSATRRAELAFAGDSAVAHVEAVAGAPPPADVRMRAVHGAIPLTNLSGLALEQVLRRARALGGDTARVPTLLMAGGRVFTAEVAWGGADSATITLAGVVFRARTDRAGRLLGATVPQQRLTFERLPGDSRAALWVPPLPADAAPASYAAPAGAPYTAADVEIRTAQGLRLAGTLTMPAHGARARVPAVVLITGSGPEDRDSGSPYLPGYRPFREIADTLSRRGIAVLRLDDRGVGGSDQGPPGATSADFAGDVRAALAWLRARGDVDPARLGLVGHSEGALIASMVAAADARVRAVVLMAAAASRGRVVSAAQVRFAVERDSTLPRARRDSLLEVARREADSAFAAPGWMRFWADYDPLPAARRMRASVLLLHGETDRQVPVAESRRLADAMRAAGNTRVTVRTFPRLNHLLVDDPSGDFFAYTALPSLHVRRDLLGVLADWLARTL